MSGDHSVDNRALTASLLALAGGTFELRSEGVRSVVLDGDRAVGVETESRERILGGQVLLAAGSWSNQIAGSSRRRPAARSAREGQIVRFDGPADPLLLSRNIRGMVKGSHLYLVSRASGRIVAGATVEEQGFDTTVTVGAVHDLLRDAIELVPAVSELELVETLAGLRPGTPDNAPIVGPTTIDGLLVATGHFRNGVLLAPITADVVAALTTSGEPPAEAAAMAPGRFSPKAAV